LNWRKSCERTFRFDPNRAVTEADKNAVREKYASKKATLEGSLKAGAGELQTFQRQATALAATLQAPLEAAARKLAQVRKNAALL
jgi:DNA-binding helix-hairpin-helix protein with protein kinase domain